MNSGDFMGIVYIGLFVIIFFLVLIGLLFLLHRITNKSLKNHVINFATLFGVSKIENFKSADLALKNFCFSWVTAKNSYLISYKFDKPNIPYNASNRGIWFTEISTKLPIKLEFVSEYDDKFHKVKITNVELENCCNKFLQEVFEQTNLIVVLYYNDLNLTCKSFAKLTNKKQQNLLYTAFLLFDKMSTEIRGILDEQEVNTANKDIEISEQENLTLEEVESFIIPEDLFASVKVDIRRFDATAGDECITAVAYIIWVANKFLYYQESKYLEDGVLRETLLKRIALIKSDERLINYSLNEAEKITTFQTDNRYSDQMRFNEFRRFILNN